MEFQIAAMDTGEGTEQQWEQVYFCLSESRRRKADRIHMPEQRRQSLAAGALLEYLLKKGNVAEPFSYGMTQGGRPFCVLCKGGTGRKKGYIFLFPIRRDCGVCGGSFSRGN